MKIFLGRTKSVDYREQHIFIKTDIENKYSFFYSFFTTKIVLIFIETTINFCNIFTLKSTVKAFFEKTLF